jgi:hypothetical protein
MEAEGMNILGLAGHAGAGKDHTYEYIRELLSPLQVTRIAFADGLKFDIEETLGLHHFDLELIRHKPYSPEIRSLLQWWGTELRRAHYGDDYWVKKGMEMAEEAGEYSHLVVVTDVRFYNEAEVIIEAGGITAEVLADEAIRRERLGGALPDPQHPSEVIDFDTTALILNDAHPILPPFVLNWLGGLT